MKINPNRLKEFAADVEDLKEDYDDIVNAEPEILKGLNKARDYAKLRHEHLSAPIPADPTKT